MKLEKIWHGLQNTFLAGLGLLLPIFVTLWVFNLLLGILNQAVPFVHYSDIPGLGIIATLLSIFIAGILARFYIGKKLFDKFEKIITGIPLANTVYNAAKQVVQIFANKKEDTTFERVVLVEWPRKGVYAVGFLTREKNDWLKIDGHPQKDMCCVFFPNVPTPATGFFMFVPRQDVHSVNLSVEDTIKMLVSGGIAAPEKYMLEESK